MKPLTRNDKRHATILAKIVHEDPTFFASRWISRYIVQSIQLCGDMSLAFDLMEKAKHDRGSLQ